MDGSPAIIVHARRCSHHAYSPFPALLERVRGKKAVYPDLSVVRSRDKPATTRALTPREFLLSFGPAIIRQVFASTYFSISIPMYI